MTTQPRRTRILARRTQLEQQPSDWRNQFRGEHLVWNILRVGMLLLVGIVVLGVWAVSSAHLGEQFLAAPKTTAAGRRRRSSESRRTG